MDRRERLVAQITQVDAGDHRPERLVLDRFNGDVTHAAIVSEGPPPPRRRLQRDVTNGISPEANGTLTSRSDTNTFYSETKSS